MDDRARHPAVAAFRALTLLALGAHIAHKAFGFGGPGLDGLFDNLVYNGLMLAGAGALIARGITVKPDRAAWLLLGGGVLAWCAGDIYYSAFLANDLNPPFPAPSDLLYLAFYPAGCAAILLLVRNRLAHYGLTLWLDGMVAALAISAIAATVLFSPIVAGIHGDPVTMAVNLAYPVGDVLLIAFVAGALALTGWRPGRVWVLLGAGLAMSAIGDGVFLYKSAAGAVTEGTLLDSVWPASVVLLAFAAWAPPRTAPARLEGWRVLALPSVFATTAVGLLIYGQFATLRHLDLALATATLMTLIVRMAVTLRENVRMLSASRGEALTDALTGLGNRRKLMITLVETLEVARWGTPRVLVLFDLDGFKRYNDTYGHPAGDGLLARLGHKLDAAVQGYGTAYRLGGDEFCVLLDGQRQIEEIIISAQAALSEHGDGFSVGCSFGAVVLPQEADDPGVALQIVDQRLYARKDARPSSARRQSTDVLLRALKERQPDLHAHLHGVAELAEAVGRRLGLDADALDKLMQAAELHDVGKVAVPDAILNKPASLDEEEWGFMRRHTILGERILSAAPALREVAALVRASHERYDGDGYPDKLVGDEIPMGARIVAVCDAFDAMTSDRPYRSAQTVEMAAAELRRCSGSQFDPVVVDAFCAELGLDELNPHDEAADTGAEPMEAPRPELAAHLMRALERFPHETAMNPSTP